MTPVTRIFLPERSAIVRLYFRRVRAMLAVLLLLSLAIAGARRRSVQDPAHHVPGRRDRLRSGQGLGLLLGHRDRGDLRSAAHLRLSRAPGEARAEHRGRRCRRSPTTAGPIRSRVKPGIYFADDPVFKGAKRELTAPTTRTRSRASSIRRTARRTRSCSRASPASRRRTALHAASSGSRSRISTSRTCSPFRSPARWRARRSSLRRRDRRAPGRHRAVPAEELHPLLEDRARGESGLPRGHCATAQRLPLHRRRRDQHHGGDAEPLARLPARRDRHRVPARGGRADLHDRGRQAQAGVRRSAASSSSAASTRRSSTSTSTCRTRRSAACAKEKIALRRAIAMAYKVEDQIRIIRKGQAIRAQYPIPPGVAGHDPEYRSSIAYDPRAANALLDKFGYSKGADGYRAPAGRHAAGHPLLVDADRARPPVRRADEALARLDRRPARDPQGPLPRADQAREPVPADDAQRGLDRRLPGRRQFHAASLRAEHRAEQQRLLPLAGVRPALREDRACCPTARSATSSTAR